MNTSPPWLSPGTWTVPGATMVGAEGHLVQVAAIHVGASQEPIRLTGLPEISVCQTRDRVRAAVVNSGLPWPDGVTVTVRPEALPNGSGLDLAIAVAVLTAAGAVAGVPDWCLFYGELGLDGSLRPVRGVVPAVLAATHTGCTQAVVPEQNAAEAVTVPGMTVIPAGSLRDVVAWLRGAMVINVLSIEGAPRRARRRQHHPAQAAAGLSMRASRLRTGGGHRYIGLVRDSGVWQWALDAAEASRWTGVLPIWLAWLISGTSASQPGAGRIAHAEAMQGLGLRPGSGPGRL